MDAKSGELIWKMEWSGVYFVAFSLDAQTVVSASRSGDVRVYNAGTGATVAGPSKRHAEGTLILGSISSNFRSAISPDGNWIAVRGATVQVFDSKTGLLADAYRAHSDTIRYIAFSPDSKRVFSTSDDTIQVHTLDC
jgi:WD40 repeat protein